MPWCAISRIDFTHSPIHRVVRWSVRSSERTRIAPKLEYASALECYNVVVREWRASVPHACREHFRRVYRRFRRAHVLLHLWWVIPALLTYAAKSTSFWIPIIFVLCIMQNLLFLKELRLDFDRWYALVEAGFTKSKTASPASSSAILRWLFPPPDDAFADEPITDLEYRVYRRWEVGGVFPFFLLVAALSCAWYLGLTWAANLLHHDVPGTRFLIRPTPPFWMIPAFFLGMITSAIPLDWLYRALLRERYRRFNRFCAERAGFDGRRLLACLSVIIFAASTSFFLAGVTSFCRFTDAGVEIQRPFSIRSVFYGYSRVRGIEHRSTSRAPAGNTVKRLHHVILFDDGTSWSSRDGLRDPQPDMDGKIADLVSRRSRRPIVEQP
jgi:hypothetical protein